MSGTFQDGDDTRIKGGTDGTLIGNTGNRLLVDASFTTFPSINILGEYNSTLPTITTGNVDNVQLSKRGTVLNTLYDFETNRKMFIDQQQTLKVAEPTRLLGGNFPGSTLNTMIWTTATSGTGATTVSGNILQLSTGTTANSSVSVTSTDVANFFSGTTNMYFAAVRLGDTGTTNNERRWGAWDGTNGVYFKLAGTTFSVCRLQNSVETAVASASFTGGTSPTIDTNFHIFEIVYSAGAVSFFQNRGLLHTITATTTSIADTPHYKLRHENKNVSGGTTNTSLYVRGATILRHGKEVGRPRSTYINTAVTTVIKTEPGTLHRVIFSRSAGLGNTTFTIYDNTAGSGTIIDSRTLPGNISPVTIDYGLDYSTGLTLVNSSANHDICVVWE